MIRTADISDDGVYRYQLGRTWQPDDPVMAWVMLNPSTADADVDDPTIRRCISFAQRCGCGGIEVINLFSYRATDPGRLRDVLRDPRGDLYGPGHRGAWRRVLLASNVLHVVAAWGAHEAATWSADRSTLPPGTVCLGTTKSGAPRHPLYVKGDAPFEPWRPS